MSANLLSISDTKIPELHIKHAGEASKIITDFLKWVEREKGLILCEPYKPQYDWFIPILYRSKDLAAEFLHVASLEGM
ncbi:MAG TPA: hypothetical protein VMV97_04440 [Sulfuriferula sp.]|nr:hypothetical protein [Sulfuriferula sp.]